MNNNPTNTYDPLALVMAGVVTALDILVPLGLAIWLWLVL